MGLNGGKRWGMESIFVVILCLGIWIPPAGAAFPERPVTAIVAFAPGGAPDLFCRPLADLAKKYLGVPITILNKPGGGGATGTLEVARAAPDGYTILFNFGGGEHLVRPHLEKLPYDTLNDFQPIMMTSYYPSGLFVKEDSPWKTLEEFIQHARKNPGAVRYAHTGQGAVNHLNALSLEKEAGLNLTGIPTGGGGQALNMLLGGHVEAAQVAVPVVWPQVEAKQVRCLAYSLPQRSDLYPGAPTYREKGYDFRFWISQGIAAPKGTPAEAIKKLHDSFAAAFKEKMFQQTMQTLRFPPYYLNTEDTAKYLAEMYQYYGQVVKKLGVTLKK